MNGLRARALPLAAEGVSTIPAPCAVELAEQPAPGRTVLADAPAGALPCGAALALRFAAADGTPQRGLCIVDGSQPAGDGRECCGLRLLSPPAPATGRAHARTAVALELAARRIEAGGQSVPIVVADVAPGGVGFASFVALRDGEFVALHDLFGEPTGVLAQVVRTERQGQMWAYGAAFGNLERAAGLVEQLLAAARAAA
jgi:hypothetical protein